RCSGTYLRSVLGLDLVVIGTYFGHATDSPRADVPPPPDIVEDLLSSLSIPLFIIDLRELPSSGPLHEWFQMPHATRSTNSWRDTYTVAPLKAYDAILSIDMLTPTPTSQKE